MAAEAKDEAPIKEDKKHPILFCPTVLCGPSGVGKGTLLKRVKELLPNTIGVAVSHTTRKPRKGEVDGVHYHYTTREDFEANLDDFVEHADVNGNYYGTSKSAISDVAPLICVLEIDVQGAAQIKKGSPLANFLFVTTDGGLDTLKKRLEGRNTETAEQIAKRLATAEKEFKFLEENDGFFDCVLSNDDLEMTAMSLVRQFKAWYPWIATDNLRGASADDDDKEESGGLIWEQQSHETLFNALQFSTTVVDLRSEDEFKTSHVEGAINLPTVESMAKLGKLSWPRVFAYDDGQDNDSNIAKRKKLFEIASTQQAVQFVTIKGSYAPFQERFPFLCVSGKQRVEYPNICPTTDGRVFVGGEAHASSVDVINDLGITHILNTKGSESKLPEDVANGIKYHVIKIEDVEDALEKQTARQWFKDATMFVEKALGKDGTKVLIHCGGGKSRSTTFTMAYLINWMHQPLAIAYGNVSNGRPKAYPNDGFLDKLEEYEVSILSFSSKAFITGGKLRNKARYKQVLASWGIQ